MTDSGTPEGTRLWTPSPELVAKSRMRDYMDWLARERGLVFQSYAELHDYSTRDLAGFWQSIWDYFRVIGHAPHHSVIEGQMPHVQWFPGATLNYAEHALRDRGERLQPDGLRRGGRHRTRSVELAVQRIVVAEPEELPNVFGELGVGAPRGRGFHGCGRRRHDQQWLRVGPEVTKLRRRIPTRRPCRRVSRRVTAHQRFEAARS